MSGKLITFNLFIIFGSLEIISTAALSSPFMYLIFGKYSSKYSFCHITLYDVNELCIRFW